MSTENSTKRTRTPRDLESITKGALALPLQERVDLKTELEKSIAMEVETLTKQAEAAREIAGVK